MQLIHGSSSIYLTTIFNSANFLFPASLQFKNYDQSLEGWLSQHLIKSLFLPPRSSACLYSRFFHMCLKLYSHRERSKVVSIETIVWVDRCVADWYHWVSPCCFLELFTDTFLIACSVLKTVFCFSTHKKFFLAMKILFSLLIQFYKIYK